MATSPYALTTLDDLKGYLNLSGSEKDTLLEALIDRVTRLFEEFCNRRLKARDYHFDPLNPTYDPANAILDGSGTPILQLPQYPVNSITTLKVNGVEIPKRVGVAGFGWVEDGFLRASGILRLDGQLFNPGLANVEIGYNAGYSQVPEDLAQACIEQAAFKFHEGFKGRLGLGARALADGSLRLEVSELLLQVREVLLRYRTRVVI